MARRFEFYVRVARTIFHSFAMLTRETLLLLREHKTHIIKLTWILCAVARFVKERTYCLHTSFMVRYTTSNPSLN